MIPHPWKRSGPLSRVMILRSRERVKCPKCSRIFASNGLARHRAACNGGVKVKLPVGHDLCGCGERWKPRSAIVCFRCSVADDPLWMALDAAVARGKREVRA